jgi:hypothetical protein
MSMRRIASVAMALCLTIGVVHAQQSTPAPAPSSKPSMATLTGTWAGTFKDDDRPDQEQTAMIVLKQDGAVVTGTAGPNADKQMAISKGKVVTTKDGTTVTFEVATDANVMQVELKLVDGHLKGGVKAEQNGEKKSAVLDLVRTK